MDTGDGWVQGTGADPFESRWSDVLLRKSLHEYYD